MRKLFVLALMCVMALSMNAQRCAVLEFKAGVGISQADVDGISAIFITYFRPAGYTMVERTQIDKAIDEQGFQRSKMTESQMVRIGEILNVSKIVVGDVNVVMGQYNVDVRVINVESGTIAATEGATFEDTSYRTTMHNIAQNLASQIAVTPRKGEHTISTQTIEYVDLGLPSGTLWKSSNEKGGFYTYDEAISKFGNNLPTQEQMDELKGLCTWEWTGKGYKITGENGQSIMLQAAGIRNCEGIVGFAGFGGRYWTSMAKNSNEARALNFRAEAVTLSYYERCNGFSVRLVKRP